MSETVIVEGEIKVFNLQELNQKIIKKYEEEPLAIIVPFGFTGTSTSTYSPVSDQLSLGIESFEPTFEDLEIIVNGLIGCIPTVGPILQGVFTAFMNLFKNPISTEELKKMIDEKLAKLKEELLVTLDEKIEKAEVENYKKLCNNSFRGLNESSLTLLMNDLNNLKKKLMKKKQPKKPFMDGLRLKFDLIRINIKALFPMFENLQFVKYVYRQYLDLIFMYILLMNNLMNFWYQYGFDPCYSRGRPAMPEYNIKQTHSYREKLHINIQRFLKTLQNGLIQNKPDLEKAFVILESDPVMYPVPLIKSKETNSKGNIEINVNQRSTPYIYRIDASNCTGSALTNPEIDSLTGCKGISLKSTAKLSVKLVGDPKFVRVRLYVAYDNSKSSLKLKLDKSNSIPSNEWTSIQDEFGTLQSKDCKEEDLCNYTSGFVQSKKSTSKESEINISITDQSNNNQNNKLLFIEIIVSDS